jgi:hypothetical protein
MIAIIDPYRDLTAAQFLIRTFGSLLESSFWPGKCQYNQNRQFVPSFYRIFPKSVTALFRPSAKPTDRTIRVVAVLLIFTVGL